jgi:predicted MFS family arabinose efflux permease
MAITAGVGVANLYYNQPLLGDIGRSFQANAHQTGIIAMSTQIGYAIGMFFFVPLGDIKERRRLIMILLLLVALSLVGVATAQNLIWMNVASLAVGITTIVPQIMIPLAATLAPPKEQGKVIGTVLSGLLFGILLARTVSGLIGGYFGWRAMFWIAAVLMLILAIILRLFLPENKPDRSITYSQLFFSLFHLTKTHATLREAAFIGAMMFGSFSAFWTSLTYFVESPVYHFNSQLAGLFGLVGVVGASAAPLVGRMADRFQPKIIVGLLMSLTLFSFLLFGLTGTYLLGLIIGIILLDLGVQGTQVANQARIYPLAPEARSRINTVFMVSTFLGGALGSFLGSYAWKEWGWSGVCTISGTMVFLAMIVWSFGLFQRKKVT